MVLQQRKSHYDTSSDNRKAIVMMMTTTKKNEDDHSIMQNDLATTTTTTTASSTTNTTTIASFDTTDTEESSHSESCCCYCCEEEEDMIIVTTKDDENINNNYETKGRRKRLRWADECCCSSSSYGDATTETTATVPLVTIHSWQQQDDDDSSSSSLRMVILLLDAASKQFEFVNVEVLDFFDKQQQETVLYVNDVLAQLPDLAAAGSIFRQSEFGALFKYNASTTTTTTSSTSNDDSQQPVQYVTLQDYNLQSNGEILLALTRTSTSTTTTTAAAAASSQEEETKLVGDDTTATTTTTANNMDDVNDDDEGICHVVEFARSLLTEKVCQAVQRACRVGRSLQTLHSSKEWESIKKEGNEKGKNEDEEEAEAVWIGILLLHPATKQFEVLHCEFWSDEVVRVQDVLQQLPRLALSRPTFTDANFVALQRPLDDDNNAAFEPILTLNEYAVQSGEVLIALTEHDANSLRKTRTFLKATLPMLRLAVQRGHRHKKARHTLLSCEQWAALLSSSSSSSTTSNGKNKSKSHHLDHYDTLLTPEQLAALTASTNKPPAILTVPHPNKARKKKTKKRNDKDLSSQDSSKGRPEQQNQKMNQVDSSARKVPELSEKQRQPLQAILTPAPTPIFREFCSEVSPNVVAAWNSRDSENTTYYKDRIHSICKVVEPPRNTAVTKKCAAPLLKKNVKSSTWETKKSTGKNQKVHGLRSFFHWRRGSVQGHVKNRIEQVQA